MIRLCIFTRRRASASLGSMLLCWGLAAVVAGCTDPQGEGSVATAQDVARALQDPHPLRRAEQLARAFQTLPPAALPDVQSAYEDAFYDVGYTEVVLLADWWASFDPVALLEFASEEWTLNTKQVRQAALRAWARNDPESAIRWIDTQRSRAGMGPLRDAVLSGWDDSGIPGMVEYVEAMAKGAERQRALATVARRKVLRDGVDAAFDWASALPDEDAELKRNALRRVGSAGAMQDPVRAAARAEEFAGTDYAAGLFRRVGSRWANRDPHAALAWLLSLPAGMPRDDGVRETYRSWSMVDPEAASALFEGERGEANPALDPALALYTIRLAGTDPLAAITLAETIEDEDDRWATVGRAWRIWWQADPLAANAWHLAAAQIPDFYHRRMAEIPPALRKNIDKAALPDPNARQATSSEAAPAP